MNDARTHKELEVTYSTKYGRCMHTNSTANLSMWSSLRLAPIKVGEMIEAHTQKLGD